MTLRADAVTVRVGGTTLLQEVTLEVRPGEVVALVGPNGAGKSTLVRVLAGDREPDQGSVSLDGRPLGRWSLGERARRRAVVMGDEDAAFVWPVREVVLLGRTPVHGGDPSVRDRHIADRALEEVDALELAERTLHTLSTGERQRVALARALAQVWPDEADSTPADERGRSSWLLLDEPTANLDLRHQSLALRLLRRRAREGGGAGILVVLHDLNLASAHADRIAVMARGSLVQVGSPAEVLRADLLATVFDTPVIVVPHPRQGHPVVLLDAEA